MADDHSDPQRQIYDKLEHDLALSHLINPESLGNLLARFGQFLGLGLLAADRDGRVLATCGGRLRPCVEAGADPAACPACASEVPVFEGEEKFVTTSCRSQARYLRARIDNQFDPVGHLVVGPFAIEPLRASVALERVPVMTAERAQEAALLMGAILEEVVFANYQSYLFSVGSSRVDLQACKLEYSIVSPK